jgi:hypothetical protein
MTFKQLVARYESGVISDHEFVAECLIRVDVHDPSAVLEKLPLGILPRVREFVDEYRAGQMLASQGGEIPSPTQVQAARSWLDMPSLTGARPVGSA